MLAATTQGPISSIILMMELTGRDRSFVLPLFLIVCVATVVARSVEFRSIYDAKLTDDQIQVRRKLRDATAQESWPAPQTGQG
jgi:CIC family chloride channel protein